MSPADGGCRSSAAAEERIFRNCILAGFRSAGSRCENNPILTSESIPHLRLGVSCKERIYYLLSPKGGAKSVRRAPPSDLIPPPVQCGGCCALRATMIICLRPYMAGLRPARMHCENSGSRDGSSASARSGSAKQRSLLCPLSERGCRHPLLFAVLDLLVLLDHAKSTRKESVRRKLFERSFAMRKLLCTSRNDDYLLVSWF